mmetsp:Transcript_28510/g.84410  ORF Transcript_28510/g.84410 Transcript_28510/m.84410 type:complete len:235 (-) Transcript_28510:1478-2182(-)
MFGPHVTRLLHVGRLVVVAAAGSSSRWRVLLRLHLQPHERRICGVAADELVVGAGLDQLATVDHRNQVRVLDRRQPVRDDNGGAPDHEVVQRLLHQALALCVERTGGLVQQHDLRVLEDCARDCDALLLPAAQAQAALAHTCLVRAGQAVDEVVRVGGLGSGNHLLLAGVRAAHEDVLKDCRREERGLLADEAGVGTKPLEVQLAEVHTVQQHDARVGVVEALQQLRDGRLPAA